MNNDEPVILTSVELTGNYYFVRNLWGRLILHVEEKYNYSNGENDKQTRPAKITDLFKLKLVKV